MVTNPPPKNGVEIDTRNWNDSAYGGVKRGMDVAIMRTMTEIITNPSRGEFAWDEKTDTYVMSLKITQTDVNYAPFLNGVEEVWILTKATPYQDALSES